jgi:8-oxo-dGTP pyrophosphatase MutT (NUDIX family)
MREGVLAILYREKKGSLPILSSKDYLVVKNSRTGNWSFVAGGKEPRESLLQAIKREIREEAGIAEKDLINIWLLPFLNEFNSDKGKQRQRCFAAELKRDAKASAGDGVSEVAWLAEKKVFDKIRIPGLKRVFESYLRRA